MYFLYFLCIFQPEHIEDKKIHKKCQEIRLVSRKIVENVEISQGKVDCPGHFH